MDQSTSTAIENLLLSTEETSAKYQELGENYEYPYVFKISKNGQALYFLGSQHLLDPEDQQFEAIRKYWQEFLKETNKKDCVVLVEAWENLAEKSKDNPKNWGESGFTTFLASEDRVQVFSPEPNRWQVRNELLKKFTQDEIVYSDFAGIAYQWNKLKNKPNFEEYIDSYTKIYKKELDWDGYNFSLQNFIRIHNETHDHEFNENDRDCFYNDYNPATNEVSREEGLIRDKHIVTEIKRLWDEGKNIFIVYGSGHAIVQEPALRELLK